MYDARMHWSPARVRAARDAAELSQRQVAEAARVSVDTVRRAENDAMPHEPGANALGRIAAALGVSIDSLYVHELEAATSSAARGNDQAPTASSARESAAGAR